MRRLALLADICAETCRFALLTGQVGDRPTFSDYDECKVAERADAYDAFELYIKRLKGRVPGLLGLSISGPLDHEASTVPQSGWTVSWDELKRRFGFEEIVALNDVAATSHSLRCMEPGDVSALGGAGPAASPEMDGPSAASAIRRREAETGRRRTPIVALTANVMSDQIAAYMDAGMDGFVAKPVQIASLFEAVRTHAVEGGGDAEATQIAARAS